MISQPFGSRFYTEHKIPFEIVSWPFKDGESELTGTEAIGTLYTKWGLLDVTGAVLPFVPRWTFYGAVVLTCGPGIAALLAIFKPALPLAIPLVFTLLAATLAWLARPHRVS